MAADGLDRVFHALADSSRRTIVERLSRGPASVSELAGSLAMALPSALKHLGVLEQGGLVWSQKSGRVRTYRLDPRALDAVESWTAERKSGWRSRFDARDHSPSATASKA
jgi:DNA-binding transcriptional ArsR family regulator